MPAHAFSTQRPTLRLSLRHGITTLMSGASSSLRSRGDMK
jgi:hypothetical protein